MDAASWSAANAANAVRIESRVMSAGTETDRLTTGKQIGNGDEVAPIGLHRVRRGFTCLPVIQELLKPLGDLLDGRRDGSSFNNAFGGGVAGIGLLRHTVSLADKYG